jgi:hypothetical protein
MKRWTLLLITITLLVLLFSACSTSVTIDTDPPGAEVRLNYQRIGTTPVTVVLSDAVWEEFFVEISKPGYRTIRTTLRKEIKPGAVVGGLLGFVVPWLYAWGPAPYHYFELEQID